MHACGQIGTTARAFMLCCEDTSGRAGTTGRDHSSQWPPGECTPAIHSRKTKPIDDPCGMNNCMTAHKTATSPKPYTLCAWDWASLSRITRKQRSACMTGERQGERMTRSGLIGCSTCGSPEHAGCDRLPAVCSLRYSKMIVRERAWRWCCECVRTGWASELVPGWHGQCWEDFMAHLFLDRISGTASRQVL